MKQYQIASIEIVSLSNEDVLTISGLASGYGDSYSIDEIFGA